MGTNTRQLLTVEESLDLRNVWMAAHFPKRIVKKLVEETNICSSVDKILAEKFAVVTYRVLGYYLIGLTRIHSKKVEYLLVDCNHSLHEMKFFSEGRKKGEVSYGGTCVPESSSKRSQLQVVGVDAQEPSGRKTRYSFVEPMRAQCGSLSLPDCFDLDTYDLDFVLDDNSDDHVKPHLELVLKDTWEDHRHAFGKEHASASTSTSIMPINIDPETSVERFMHRFALEERLDPMVLSDSDDELVPNSAPLFEHEPQSINNVESSMMAEVVKSPDKEERTTEQTVVAEMTLKPSPGKSQLSVAVNVTPESRGLVESGKRKPQSVAVRTPASRLDIRAPRKRKCVYDYAINVPDKVYKTWVSDASDLVRKRRTPDDVIERNEKRGSFDRFMQPKCSIFPDFQSDLSSVISENVRVVVEQVEETAGPAISKGDESKRMMVEVVEEAVGPTMSKNNELGPLNVHITSEETEAEVIAPLTPATQSASLRFNEVHETSMVNQVGPTSSCESRERMMSPIRNVDLDETQTAEGPSTLGDESQENVTSVLVAEKLSAATKSIGGYLHSKFVHSKEKGEEEALNLSQILKQRTKKESAKFFYQILVLKTGGYIDVKQEKPYEEICLKQTEKMRAVFGGGRRK